MNAFRVISVALLSALVATAQAADPRGADSATARLLTLSQKNTPPAVAAARAEYEKLKQAHPIDVRLDYVYGLALINQHRYADAMPLVDQYLAEHPDDLPAVRAKIWAELANHDDAEAIRDAVQLCQQFRGAAAAQPKPELEETARFVGTVFGYLGFVRRDLVDQELRLAAKDRVFDALGQTYLPFFDKGRQVVAERLSELDERRQQKQRQAIDNLAQRRQEVDAELADDRLQIASRQESNQSSAEQLDEARRQWGVLSTQLASLEKDRIRLAARMTYVQTLLVDIQNDLANNPNRARIDAAARYSNLSVTYTALTKQALRLDEQATALRTQMAKVSAVGQRESQKLAENRAATRESVERVKALEWQVNRLEAKVPQPRGMTAEMKRLSTYLPFPFEEEKRRVLGWFQGN